MTNSRSTYQSPPFRGALISSGVMAFAGLGDAILYPVLPVYADKLDIPLVWVGLLLSINRFVRILANTWIANIVNTFGMKRVLLIASSLAIVTTVSYGLKLGLVSFIMARIIWGLSYSGLKTSTLNYAAIVKSRSGLVFGITQSIKSFGALSALWIGPILISHYGITIGLFIIGSIGLIAVFLTFYLPDIKNQNNDKVISKLTFSPTPINLLINILAFAIDGILVVTLASMFVSKSNNPENLLAVVAFYLLLKRLFMVIASFISGLITIKIMPIKIFISSVVICTLGLMLIAANQIAIGIVLAFFFNTMVVTFAPLISIRHNKNISTLQVISSATTWWDLGAGLGAFSGLILIEIMGQQYLYITLSILVIILFINFIFNNGKTNRTTV